MATQQIQSQRFHDQCKEEAIERIQRLTSDEQVKFLEYAASHNPVITNAWLNHYEGNCRC